MSLASDAPAGIQLGAPAALRWRQFALVAVLAATCLLPFLLSLRFLGEPFDRDEGAYITVAQGMLDGKVPYRDLFDHKPPLVYGWYAAVVGPFGPDREAVRLAGAAVLAFSGLAVFWCGRWMFSARAGAIAALAFAGSTGIAVLEPNVNTEAFMIMPLTASLAAFVMAARTGRVGWLAAAGALCAAATLTKTVAVWHLPVLLAEAWLLRSAFARGRDRWPAVAVGTGFVAVVLAALAPFAVAGAIDDLWYANVGYNQLYAAEPSWHERWDAFRDSGATFLLVATPLVLGAILAAAHIATARVPFGRLALLWLLASTLGVASTGHFLAHYYVQLLPPLALLCGLVPDACSRLIRGRIARNSFAAAATLVLAWTILINTGPYLPADHEARNYEKDGSDYAARANELPAIASYIAARTEPGEPIFNFGRETQLHVYADRPPAVPFMYDRPYRLDPATFDKTMALLRRTPPRYIVHTLKPEDAARYPQMQDFLAELYEQEAVIAFAIIYRLKP